MNPILVQVPDLYFFIDKSNIGPEADSRLALSGWDRSILSVCLFLDSLRSVRKMHMCCTRPLAHMPRILLTHAQGCVSCCIKGGVTASQCTRRRSVYGGRHVGGVGALGTQ